MQVFQDKEGTITRASNMRRAEKCEELGPEWAKAYKNSIHINADRRYVYRYNKCMEKGTPIPNGPVPKRGVKPHW